MPRPERAPLLLLALVLLGGCSGGCWALQQDASASHHVMRVASTEAQLSPPTPTYCMPDGDDEEMANIRAVLNMWGFTETEDPLQATLLWYAGHPFRGYCPYLSSEQQAQLLERLRQDPAQAHLVVNSHPGLPVITAKKQLAALSGTLPFLPRTFRLPTQHAQWQAFMDSEEGAGMQWMRKGLQHKGITFLLDPKSPEHASSRMLVQQRIRPYLVHKRLWDIGLFVSVTTVDPLMAYVHTGIGVLRMTREETLNNMMPDTDPTTYIIDFLKGWHLKLDAFEGTKAYFQGVPGGVQPLTAILSMLSSQGVNTTDLLQQAQSHIVQLLTSVNSRMREAESQYPAARTNGFMWTRFDFILDESHKLYLIEANMSPSIPRRGFSDEGQLWKMGIAHDVLTLNGLSPGGLRHPGASTDLQRLVADPVLLDVEEPACAGSCRDSCASTPRCVLCSACRDERQNRILQRLQAEASGAHHFRRVYPPPQHLAAYMQGQGVQGDPELESRPDNVLVATWLQAKCGLEPRFC